MKRCAAILTALLAITCVHAEPANTGTADARFETLYKTEWAWRLEQFPGLDDDDNQAGKYDDRLPRVDAATQAKQLAYWQEVLRQLAAIPFGELSAENRVNYAVYKPQLENLAAGVRFRAYEMPFNSDSQFWSDLAFMSGRHLKNV